MPPPSIADGFCGVGSRAIVSLLRGRLSPNTENESHNGRMQLDGGEGLRRSEGSSRAGRATSVAVSNSR